MRWKLTILLVPVFKMRSSFVGYGSSGSSGGFDAGPRAGPDAFRRRARFRGLVQPALHLGSRIQRNVLENTRIDQGTRGDIIVPVINRVADVGDHLRPQDKIDELVGGLRMRRARRDEQREKILI